MVKELGGGGVLEIDWCTMCVRGRDINRRPLALCVTANGQSTESGATTTGSRSYVQVCLFFVLAFSKHYVCKKFNTLLYVVKHEGTFYPCDFVVSVVKY